MPSIELTNAELETITNALLEYHHWLETHKFADESDSIFPLSRLQILFLQKRLAALRST